MTPPSSFLQCRDVSPHSTQLRDRYTARTAGRPHLVPSPTHSPRLTPYYSPEHGYAGRQQAARLNGHRAAPPASGAGGRRGQRPPRLRQGTEQPAGPATHTPRQRRLSSRRPAGGPGRRPVPPPRGREPPAALRPGRGPRSAGAAPTTAPRSPSASAEETKVKSPLLGVKRGGGGGC